MAKIVWLARAFLDYRAPVAEELSRKYGGDFYLVVSTKWMPSHILERLEKSLGDNLIALDDEITLGTKNLGESMANSRFRFPIQPGIMKVIKELSPDVIIGDGFFQWSFYGYVSKLFSSSKMVICYERTKHTERNSQWYRNLYRKFMVKITDSFCCNGSLTTEYLKTLGVSPSKVTEGYMVHEQKDIVPDQSKVIFKDNENQKVFLFVGQLIKRKGIDLLVQAWNERMSNTNSKLVIVGSGPLDEWLVSYISDNNLSNIELVGKVEHKNILSYYHSCDVFVMPTLEDNWSLVVPEAMSFGKPVITTIYNGCYPELIRDNTGITTDPLSDNSLATSLYTMYEKRKDELEEMGVAAKILVDKRNPETAAKAIINAVNISLS